MEAPKKSESNHSRKSQRVEHKGDGDKSKSSSSTSRTPSIRSTNKQSVGSVQTRTTKQSSASKSNSINASSSHVTNKSTSSKMKSESVTKLNDDSMVKKRKSRESVGHSEKRGLSTMYIPKSTAGKLKPNEKTAHRTSRDKEKLQDSSVRNQSKPRISSRERRKSRTLSPSEVKMLHSASKRPEKVGQNSSTSNHRQAAQMDSDNTNYDYEDDFEVKKAKSLSADLSKSIYEIAIAFCVFRITSRTFKNVPTATLP